MSRSTTCRARSSTRMTICESSSATTASRRCTSSRRSCCSPAALSRFPALPGRERLLRRGRRRGAGRASAWRACAIPSGKSFEDHAPDGRWYRILRRRVAGGGTVTVMTDITEQKQAERDLLDATRRTEEANRLITEKNRDARSALQPRSGTRIARWRSRRRRSPNGMRGSKRALPSRWRRSGRCPSSRGFSRPRSAT